VETTTTFRFDRDYKNTEQVRPYLRAFLAAHAEIVGAGQYPYNASFKGKVGAEGPDEDTAIYLLQTLKELDELRAKVAGALADGFEQVDHLDEGVTKYRVVVHYGWYMGGTGWQAWDDARLVIQHRSRFVMPKGKRTNGHLLSGKVLVKR
jgi:hypothetical protein